MVAGHHNDFTPMSQVMRFHKASNDQAVNHSFDAHETTAIFFSSGTTGKAKGVELTHNNIVAHLHTRK